MLLKLKKTVLAGYDNEKNVFYISFCFNQNDLNDQDLPDNIQYTVIDESKNIFLLLKKQRDYFQVLNYQNIYWIHEDYFEKI
jgi:hypothetical protein